MLKLVSELVERKSVFGRDGSARRPTTSNALCHEVQKLICARSGCAIHPLGEELFLAHDILKVASTLPLGGAS
jgi:hypothetical protein